MTLSSGAMEISPVRKSLRVSRDRETVFRRFTREIGAWWPATTHSVGKSSVVAVILEERIGGRVFERLADGTEHDWGEIVAWDPPARFVMTWHPGRDRSSAQELEVCFSAEGGQTRIDLTHLGWERLGEDAAELRRSYSPGWDAVLAHFPEIES